MPSALKKFLPSALRQLLKTVLFRYHNRGFQPYVSEVHRFGESFKFYVGDRIGERWHLGGWDWNEIAFLKERLIRAGDVVFECGAHHGEVTLFLSRWVGDKGSVVSFEPVPRNGEIIQKNIELNGLQNVTLVRKAVGAGDGTIRMTDESNAQVAGRRGVGFDVGTVALDRFIHQNPTMLKIDVEGFEAEALRGAQEIVGRRPKFALEIHTPSLHRYGTSVEQVLSMIELDAYDLWIQLPHQTEIRPYDGGPITTVAHLFGIPKAEESLRSPC